MVKHTETIRGLLPMECLGVFDHFMELAIKGLTLAYDNVVIIAADLSSGDIKTIAVIGYFS